MKMKLKVFFYWRYSHFHKVNVKENKRNIFLFKTKNIIDKTKMNRLTVSLGGRQYSFEIKKDSDLKRFQISSIWYQFEPLCVLT